MQPNTGNKNKYTRLAIVLALLFVVVAGVAFYIKSTQNKDTAVCSDQLLQEAGLVLDKSDHEQLRPFVEDIEELENFDQDPNCLYILVTYYVNINDPASARSHFEQLQAIYDPEVGFSEFFGGDVKTLNELRVEVEQVEQMAEDINNNTQGFSNQE